MHCRLPFFAERTVPQHWDCWSETYIYMYTNCFFYVKNLNLTRHWPRRSCGHFKFYYFIYFSMPKNEFSFKTIIEVEHILFQTIVSSSHTVHAVLPRDSSDVALLQRLVGELELDVWQNGAPHEREALLMVAPQHRPQLLSALDRQGMQHYEHMDNVAKWDWDQFLRHKFQRTSVKLQLHTEIQSEFSKRVRMTESETTRHCKKYRVSQFWSM